MDLLIPQPNAVLELHMLDGATIRLRRHGNKHGPRLVLSHGNGFAIDAYFPFWRLLVTDHDLILFDQRNHGHNPLHVLAHHTQWQMADDLEVILRAIASAFGERPIAGIFHSLSTTVSLLHSDRYGWPWDALILIDPPLAPAPDHPLRPLTSLNEIGLSHWARQRQHHFRSHEELAEHFRRARRMRRWVAGAADLMARAITRATEAGWELVCPPAFEAAIYLQNASAPVWPILSRAADKLLVISADPTARAAGLPSRVCEYLPDEFGIAVAAIPDSGHLLQIEHPETVAAIIRGHLRAKGLMGVSS